MKWLLLPAVCLAFASCDQNDNADTSHLDATPVLRENAELKKKVAALEKEKEELTASLEKSERMYRKALRAEAETWGEKMNHSHERDRAARAATE